MRIGAMIGADGTKESIDDVVRLGKEIEAAGLDHVWIANICSYAAITTLALIVSEPSRVRLGAAGPPTYPRPPAAGPPPRRGPGGRGRRWHSFPATCRWRPSAARRRQRALVARVNPRRPLANRPMATAGSPALRRICRSG